jgi:hypothetical protein
MNMRNLLFAVFAVCFAGCASDIASAPRIKYPVTYTVQLGNTQVRSDYGPQNMNTQATQQVAVEVGKPLYFRVDAPFDVNVQVSEVSGGSSRQVSQLEGRRFNGMLTPDAPNLEFSFRAARPNTGGPLQFTLSDQPLQP